MGFLLVGFSAGLRAAPEPPAVASDPLVWRTGNRAWLGPMVLRGVEGRELGVSPGFFSENLARGAGMTPNHEGQWRALRYLAAARGEGGDLAAERRQLGAWFERQRREGLQLDEPGGYLQEWAAGAAVAALAARADATAHPCDPEALGVYQGVLGWWRDFGAYYGRLRTADGRLLRVGARQIHRPRDDGFDEVLLDLLLGPPAGGESPAVARWARKPEREWQRRGMGAWAAREAMAQGVPLARVAREGLAGPLPRIWNRVYLEPGRWVSMPRIDGRSPVRWASWVEGGEIRVEGQPIGHGVRSGVWEEEGPTRWSPKSAQATGPDAPLPPLPELPEIPHD